MRHSSLTAFLNGALRPDELWTEIEAEVTACLAACVKGGSGHVIFTNGSKTLVSRQHVDTLLAALAQEKLPLEAAAYLADALIMSDDFEWDDEAIAEPLFFLSDQSRPLTHTDVEDARSRLAASH